MLTRWGRSPPMVGRTLTVARTLPEQRVQLHGMPWAGTDWELDTEMLTYSRAKGAFAGSRWKVHRSAKTAVGS